MNIYIYCRDVRGIDEVLIAIANSWSKRTQLEKGEENDEPDLTIFHFDDKSPIRIRPRA